MEKNELDVDISIQHDVRLKLRALNFLRNDREAREQYYLRTPKTMTLGGINARQYYWNLMNESFKVEINND
jgi:hypothetical protein